MPLVIHTYLTKDEGNRWVTNGEEKYVAVTLDGVKNKHVDASRKKAKRYAFDGEAGMDWGFLAASFSFQTNITSGIA